jgi:hypothetical protein
VKEIPGKNKSKIIEQLSGGDSLIYEWVWVFAVRLGLA